MQFVTMWIKKLLAQERSLKKLSLSICLGVFFAILPVIPLQTPITLLCSWILKLNSIVAVSVLYVVNNPLTLIPIYIINYRVGAWFFASVLHIDPVAFNPSWIESFNASLKKYVDLEKYLGTEQFCFWCLLVGGFLCALVVSACVYPLVRIITIRVVAHLDKEQALS